MGPFAIKILLLLAFFYAALADSFTGEAPLADRKTSGIGTFHGDGFLSRSLLADSLMETRVFLGGILALETTVSPRARAGVHLHQVSDGSTLVQLVYRSEGSLADCSIEKDDMEVGHYIERFLGLSGGILSESSIFRTPRVFSINRNRVFQRLHGLIPETLMEDLSSEDATSLDEPLRSLVDLHRAEQQCLEFQGAFLEAAKKAEKIQSAVHSNGRYKRSMVNATIVRGTRWCGSGSQAENFQDLGENVEEDRCCRDHDSCPHFITGFSTRYNLYNWRPFTIVHCACDDAFRHCLRDAGTQSADLVGRIFFNVLRTPCFKFVRAQVCVDRAWFGRCRREEYKYVARRQNPFTYTTSS